MNKVIIIAALAMLSTISAHAVAQDQNGATREFTDPDGFQAEETPGGYEPANPPLPSKLAPGTRIVFTPQTLTPSQAYPAPEADKTYPRCTSERRDSCRQPDG